MEEFHTALLAGALYRTETRIFRRTGGESVSVAFASVPTVKELEAELPRLIETYTATRDAHTDRYRIALRTSQVLDTQKVPWEHCPYVKVDRLCTVNTPVVLRDGEPAPADPLIFTYNDDLGISSADMYTYMLIVARIQQYRDSMMGGGYLCREAKWLETLRGLESCYRTMLTRRATEGAHRRRRVALAAWGRANPRA